MQFYPHSTLFAVHLALNPNNNRVPANVKAALTRKYNAAQKGVKAGVRATKVAKERFTEDAEDDDEEEDDDEAEAEVAVVAKPSASSSKKNKGKAKA